MFETLRPNGFRNTRVDDICAPLGYPRERTCGRSWKILSHKTVTFRKKFIKKTPDLEEGAFPINPQHPLARQCAESFADFSRKLFPSSAEALKRGWPTYPRDKAKIIEGIATLMCYQEFNWRKNEKYKVMAPAREMTDDIQEETGSDDEIHNERGRSNRESAGSYSSLRNEHIAQYAVTENIRIHLEYTYPLTVPPAPPTIDCLFNDNLDDFDLNNIDPFAYRYLHERCLYQSRPPNEHAITHFVEDLCGQVGKDFDQEKLFHMEKKCQLFVGKIFIYWKEYDKGGYGFLHKVDGVVTRTPEFEAAWRARRREWVDTVQGGYKDAPLELRRGPLPALVNQKRARSSSLPTEAPTTKRHRADQDSNESSEGFTITVDTPGLENEEMHTSVEELRAGQFNETHKSNDGLPRDTSTDWFGSIPYPPTSATPDPSTPEMDIEQPANALDITPPVLQGFNNFSSTAPEQMESDAAFSLRAQENALPSIISSSSRAEDPPSAVSSPSPTAPNKSTENDILPWDSTLFNRPELSKRCVAPIIEASEVLRATLLKLKSSVTIGTTLPPGPGDYDQPVINSALARNETNSPSEPSKNTPTSARFSPAVEYLPANVNHGLPDNIIPSASTEGSPIPLPSQTRSISAAVYENNTSLPSPISRSNSINMPATRVEHTPPPSNVPDYMDLTVANEGSSRPYAFSGSVLQNHQSIQPNDTPVVANANSIQPAIPNKPTLQFAIEDADSIPDEDPAALVSLEQLSDLSLTDFFTLVATRSGKPRKEALQHVTFRCQWGTMITLVANRDGGEEGWQKIKGKMRLIFKNEPLRYLKKKKFSVCVYAGDHRVCGVDSDEED